MYLNKREFKQAEEYYSKAVEEGYKPNPNDSMGIAYLYKKTGRKNEAISLLESSIKRDEDILKDNAAKERFPVINIRLATSYAILDENEKALRCISDFEKLEFTERKFDNWSWLDRIQIYPEFENLWDDPEFKAIVKRAQEEKAALLSELREMEERGEIDL